MKIFILFGTLSSYHLSRVTAFDRLVKENGWLVSLVQRLGYQKEYPFFNAKTDSSISFIPAYSTKNISPNVFQSTFLMIKTIHEYDPDYLVFGLSSPVYYSVLLWCYFKRKKTILMSESKEDDEPRIWWKEAIKSFLVNKYSSALVGGYPHKRYLLKLGFPEDAIFMGYDVVDNSVFHPDKIKQLPSPIHKPYFLSINRFVAKKNLPLLITAYAYYHQKVGEKAWDLVLCGDGELRPQIEGLIKQYQLENHVHLPGFLQQDELLPYFAHAKTFIHASTTEQWGLVVNEAMAAGLPIIVSNRCGCFEDLVMEGVNGFGFNPENQAELTNLMVKMSSEDIYLEAMGKASLSHIENYSPDYFAQGLKSAIEFAMRKK